MHRRVFLACVGAFMAATIGLARPAAADDVVVFAAASLKDALDALNADWQKSAGKHATISYGASPALAKQIESGAPADVFISADLDWMDYLDQKKQIVEGSRRNLLGNSLVLVAPADSKAAVEIAPGFPLARLLDGGKLAMADPNAVPAGKYGNAALSKLGVWESVAGSVAAAETVRAALLLVARGEAPLGIVYKTDAAVEPKVKILATFPADSHPAITYPVGRTVGSKNPDAAAFIVYLGGTDAAKQFERFGFAVLGAAR